jgi:hypothetical protein
MSHTLADSTVDAIFKDTAIYETAASELLSQHFELNQLDRSRGPLFESISTGVGHRI